MRGQTTYIYTCDQVRQELARLLETRSQRQLAAEMQLSHGYINDVLNGRRAPGPSVLRHLGFEKLAGIDLYVSLEEPRLV